MNSTICWPDKTLPVEIHCAPGILTALEIIAADGLLAIPRIGLGVGGLLLGTRGGGRIEVLRSLEIPCSHAQGPAFVLTQPEIAASLELPAADCERDEIVGWYCSKPGYSKTLAPTVLTDNDRALFDALCPERWQVALLIRPSMGKTTTAAFALRDGDSGDAVLLGASLELAWQELVAYQEPQPEAAPAAAVGMTVAQTPAITSPVSPSAPAPAFMPTPMGRSGTLFGAPGPDQTETKKSRHWPLRLLFAAIFLAILAATAFFTQSYWMPRPQIALIASSDWRGAISVLWNSEALSERDRATLVIEDGKGPLHTIHLDQAGVRAGWYQYDCRPGSVTATLLAGDLSDTVTITVKPEPPRTPYSPESEISK